MKYRALGIFSISAVVTLAVLSVLTIQAQSGVFALTSTAFEDGGEIPLAHSCFSSNTSPELEWENPPEGTESFALIMIDIDNPFGGGFTHWVIYDIQSTSRKLDRALVKRTTLPGGVKQGLTDSLGIGYLGPCPPQGVGSHRYVFTLYALDVVLTDLEPRVRRSALEQAMEDHILAETELLGTYENN
jgi:hypothetical protein